MSSLLIIEEIKAAEALAEFYRSIALHTWVRHYMDKVSVLKIQLEFMEKQDQRRQKEKELEKKNEGKLTSSIKHFLQFRVSTDIGGYILTFLLPEDIH